MKKLIIIVFFLSLIVLTGCGGPKVEMILGIGQDTIEINSVWNDAGATLKVGEDTYKANVNGVVDSSTVGLYKIEYTYEYKGKSYTTIRYVYVVDQTKPEITLKPGIDTVKKGEVWVDAGVVVIDNSNADVEVTVSGEVDINTAGSYEIIYEVTDTSGNTAKITRYVYVYE